MAKINIVFNNRKYSVDTSNIFEAKNNLQTHLSSVINGSGASVNFDGCIYNIDSIQLSSATSDFVSYLETVPGDGIKVVVNDAEYYIDSIKINDTVSEFENTLDELSLGNSSSLILLPGLYQTGAIALYKEQGAEAAEGMMITPWDQLLANGTIQNSNNSVSALNKNIAGDLVLPDDGSIENIGEEAFYRCYSLTGITIPDSVTSIGDYAFWICESLESVFIGSGVTSIGELAFYDCAGLTSITVDENNAVYYSSGNCLIELESQTLILGCNTSVIPESVTSIGDDAFYGCESLTSIEIPDSVTSIGSSAFYNCNGLTSIVIPEGVTSIGGSAFNACSGLLEIHLNATSFTTPNYSCFRGAGSSEGFTVIVAENVTQIPERLFSESYVTEIVFQGDSACETIGVQAFSLCTSLTSVTIPDSVTFIDAYAFKECTGLTSVTFAEESQLTTIEGVFYNCTGLTSIEIPASVTSIGNYAFASCTSLTSIEIPASVTSIGTSAFNSCKSLTSIELPDSVTSIGINAFASCTSLASIEIQSETLVTYGSNMLSRCDALTAIYVPADLVDSYKAAAYWRNFADIIQAIS